MTMAQSLMDFILNLLRDNDAKAAFVADPHRALADAGLGEVCSEDVSDAMSYVAEYHPVTFVGNPEDHPAPTNFAPHPANDGPDHNYRPDHNYGPDPHASPVHQLQYVTNNYSYTDNHDTLVDKSVNQHILNEGTLAQRFDDHSVTATDHSVASGGDIDGPVANGNNNVLGDGDSVGNTTRLDDHSVRTAFTGNNIADHGGVAGHDNNDNATNPQRSNVATDHSALENSPRTSQDTTNNDSFNDSHNDDSHHDDSHHNATTDSLNHHNVNDESFNHNVNNHESFDHDSAITSTDQHGLLNANLSPAIALPIHDNALNVLSDNEHHLPT
jgi:hypothetical protein